jgi:hypothetical protein
VAAEIDDDAAEVLLVETAGAVEDFIAWLVNDFDAGIGVDAAADEEGSPGVGDLEGGGRQLTAGPVVVFLPAADPELALVLAAHVAAAGVDRVALDGLAGERLAVEGPVLERAGFEVEVQGPAVVAFGQHSLGRRRGRFTLREGGTNKAAAGDEDKHPAHGEVHNEGDERKVRLNYRLCDAT